MSLAGYLQLLLSGLTQGSAYGLIALGFTVIFNTTGIINFAQGEFVMLGGILSVVFIKVFHLNLFAAIALAIICTTLIAALIERLLIRSQREASVINLIILTIGISILIRGVTMLIWSKDTYAVPAFSDNTPIIIYGASVMPQNIWVMAITVFLLVAIKVFFSRTIYGKGMLACSIDKKAAALVGINVQSMILLSFMISGFVGAVAGAILAPLTLTSYDVGIMLGLKGFAAAVLGGLGNPLGAAMGGLLLGVLESFGAGLISSAYKDAFAFMILLILLFFKPSGLFGKASSESV